MNVLTPDRIKYIVVHASEWPELWWWGEDRPEEKQEYYERATKNFAPEAKARFESGRVLARDIHWYHMYLLGWDGIGYHEVIERSGNCQPGRPWYWQGAHVKEHNHESVGVCLVGRSPFEDDQLKMLHLRLGILKYEFPGAEIVGHRDLDPSKECPTIDVNTWNNQPLKGETAT